MDLISFRSVFSMLPSLISALFFTTLASAKTPTHASSTHVVEFTHEIRQVYTTSITDEPRSKAIRKYLADIFGVPGFKTSWYDNIIVVEVSGDTVTIRTNLSGGDEKIITVCGVVSGFIYSNLNVHLGIRKVKIIGASGEVLVSRESVMDDCPYKSSPNPALQPPGRRSR